MILSSICIQNAKVYVGLSKPLMVVTVGDFANGRQACFMNMPGLEERFKELEENFNEEIDFEAAVYFFNPASGKMQVPAL